MGHAKTTTLYLFSSSFQNYLLYQYVWYKGRLKEDCNIWNGWVHSVLKDWVYIMYDKLNYIYRNSEGRFQYYEGMVSNYWRVGSILYIKEDLVIGSIFLRVRLLQNVEVLNFNILKDWIQIIEGLSLCYI